MRHLGFIAVAYALGVAVPLVLGGLAWARARAASRTLSALDTRRGRAA